MLTSLNLCAKMFLKARHCAAANDKGNKMALEIALHPLGIAERGDPSIIWAEAKGNSRYCLEILLNHFWCPMAADGAEGPSIMIRFT